MPISNIPNYLSSLQGYGSPSYSSLGNGNQSYLQQYSPLNRSQSGLIPGANMPSKTGFDANSFLGKGVNAPPNTSSSFFGDASMSDYGAALSGIGSVLGAGANIYGAFKSAGMAEDAFKFAKASYYRDYYSQKETNDAREIKQRDARDNSTVPGGTSALNAKLDANAANYKSRTNT
jgi:hypothetical protein